MANLSQFFFLIMSLRRTAFGFAWICAMAALPLLPSHAQRFTVIHNFSGGADGMIPDTGTVDAGGHLYGTTVSGGTRQQNCPGGCGTVFKLTEKNGAWILSTLYNFTGGNDGEAPQEGVAFGPDGGLYGTTFYAGAAGWGTVYKLQPPSTICHSVLCPWTETTIHTFTGGTDGKRPWGGLTFDSAGNIYGTTQSGGNGTYCGDAGCGVVYEVSPSGRDWNERLLYTFIGGPYGDGPQEGVVFDSAGNFYGTCMRPAQFGSVFELMPSPSGYNLSFIHRFQGGADGSAPLGLIIDSAGGLYGTTQFGGSGSGGTVYSLTPQNGNWFFGVLYPLLSISPYFYGPVAPLTMDAAGNLYGTSFQGGEYGMGSVFKLEPAVGYWTYTSLHDFTGGQDGMWPASRVALDSQGNVYGTAEFGGFFNQGVAFKIAQ